MFSCIPCCNNLNKKADISIEHSNIKSNKSINKNYKTDNLSLLFNNINKDISNKKLLNSNNNNRLYSVFDTINSHQSNKQDLEIKDNKILNNNSKSNNNISNKETTDSNKNINQNLIKSKFSNSNIKQFCNNIDNTSSISYSNISSNISNNVSSLSALSNTNYLLETLNNKEKKKFKDKNSSYYDNIKLPFKGNYLKIYTLDGSDLFLNRNNNCSNVIVKTVDSLFKGTSFISSGTIAYFGISNNNSSSNNMLIENSICKTNRNNYKKSCLIENLKFNNINVNIYMNVDYNQSNGLKELVIFSLEYNEKCNLFMIYIYIFNNDNNFFYK